MVEIEIKKCPNINQQVYKRSQITMIEFFFFIVNLFSTKLKQVAKCGQCEKVDAKMVTKMF